MLTKSQNAKLAMQVIIVVYLMGFHAQSLCDDEIEEDGDTDLDEDEEEQNFEEEAFQ